MRLAAIGFLVLVGLAIGLVVGRVIAILPTAAVYLTAAVVIGLEIVRRRKRSRRG